MVAALDQIRRDDRQDLRLVIQHGAQDDDAAAELVTQPVAHLAQPRCVGSLDARGQVSQAVLAAHLPQQPFERAARRLGA